jgi:hypothetical protein
MLVEELIRIVRIPAPLSRVALCWLAAALVGCSGEAPPLGEQATPRKDDPELTHSWQLPADQSVLSSADLGSKPPGLADALMAGSAAPGIAHRIATACAQQGALAGTTSVALRLSIADGGAVGTLEGDPAGAGATCIADAFRAELAKLDPLPAGAALMVLRFHAATPPR